MPVAPTMTLAEYCPDLAQWPQRWQSDEQDIAAGQHIVEFLTPFLLHLLDERLAIKTLHRHRDHLWMLGGELLRNTMYRIVWQRYFRRPEESGRGACQAFRHAWRGDA